MCVDLRNLKVSKNLFSPRQKFKKHNIEESSKYDMLSLKRLQRFLKCTSDDHSCFNTWDPSVPIESTKFQGNVGFF